VRWYKLLYVFGVLCASFLLFSHDAKAAPATFTVNSVADGDDANIGDGICETSTPGECTLRAAINQASNNGNPSDMDVIEFNIPGTGVHTITPNTCYYNNQQKVTINGYTQPGSGVNTAVAPAPTNTALMIEIDGGNTTNCVGLVMVANDSVVRGLAINNFTYNAIQINDADSVQVIGNYIGTDVSGVNRKMKITGGAISSDYSDGLVIGGAAPADRNVIAGNKDCVSLNGSNMQILGNYLGLGSDGLTPFETRATLTIGTGTIGYPPVLTNNRIGGPNTGEMNVIANGSSIGANIYLADGGNIVQGNYIATDYTGLPNPNFSRGQGIAIAFDSNENLVGGTNPGEGNIIAGTGGTGITIGSWEFTAYATTWTPMRNSILGNSIYDIGNSGFTNFGDSSLGIDMVAAIDGKNVPDGDVTAFSNQGPDPNDSGDSDTGPNNYINTPVLKTAQQIGNDLTITYDLDAADSPSNTYRIEFFANDNSTVYGAGPGQEYLGTATSVTAGVNRTVTLNVSGDYTDKALSATTTAIDGTTASGFGSTSEFSQNISIGSATDFDADGIADSVEDLGPNNGDGNNDGTPDRLQPTVTTYEIDSTGIYATLVTSGCSENGTVASIDVTALAKNDNGKAYPYGLTDFTLNCSRGDTVDVTMYIHTETNPDQYIPRKYNATTQTFFDIPGSALTNEQVGAGSALKLSYSITDGGELDDDGEANGIIVDPVGLALTVTGATGALASTGENLLLFIFGASTLIAGGVWLSLKTLKK